MDDAAQLLDETLQEEKNTDEKLTELAESEINVEAEAVASELVVAGKRVAALSEVKSEMHRYRGKAKSGPGGKGGTVKSRKQAIAIGLLKARKKGKKVPRRRATDKRCTSLRQWDEERGSAHDRCSAPQSFEIAAAWRAGAQPSRFAVCMLPGRIGARFVSPRLPAAGRDFEIGAHGFWMRGSCGMTRS